MAEIEQGQTSGPGKMLASARSDSGYTQEEVADRLHLSVTIVRKLEADEYDEDIPDAFARGYLRNYAKVVELDQQEVIAKYSQFIGSTMVKNYYEPSKEVGSPQRGMQTLNQIMIWIVLAVVAIVIAIWFMSKESESEAEPLASTTAPITTEAQQPTEQQITTESEQQATDSQTQQVLDVIDSEPEVVEQETSPVPTGCVDTSEAMLTFEFLGDVWVQVTDANGEVLAVGLKAAGRRFQVSGIAPIDVVLGKPREVYIAYNEEEVDLSCFPAGSTARFSLENSQACDN